MARVEELEMAAHREQLAADVQRLVATQRAIFAGDVPEIDEALSERPIVAALRQAPDRLARPGPR